jgi:hypothetical protein
MRAFPVSANQKIATFRKWRVKFRNRLARKGRCGEEFPPAVISRGVGPLFFVVGFWEISRARWREPWIRGGAICHFALHITRIRSSSSVDGWTKSGLVLQPGQPCGRVWCKSSFSGSLIGTMRGISVVGGRLHIDAPSRCGHSPPEFDGVPSKLSLQPCPRLLNPRASWWLKQPMQSERWSITGQNAPASGFGWWKFSDTVESSVPCALNPLPRTP